MNYDDFITTVQELAKHIHSIPLDGMWSLICEAPNLAREISRIDKTKQLEVHNPSPREREFLDFIDGISDYYIEYGTNILSDCYRISLPNT